MKMTESLTTIKDKVASLLNDYPVVRDSDKLLWIAYLNKYHGLKTMIGEESYKIFKDVLMSKDTPTMESVRRVRQKFQEEGKYTGEKRHQRLVESEGVKEWTRNNISG